jgi:hypothetical protein
LTATQQLAGAIPFLPGAPDIVEIFA